MQERLTLFVIPAIFAIWERAALACVNRELAAGLAARPDPLPAE